MLIYIIILAVIAFLIIIGIIYRSEIISFIKRKVSKKSKPKKEDKPAKPKEEKPTYTVEDFKPIEKSVVTEERDASIKSLFGFDDFLETSHEHIDADNILDRSNLENNNLFSDNEKNNQENILHSDEKDSTTLTAEDRRKLDAFFSNDDALFKPIKNRIKFKDEKENISKQIKDLSPELKALLIDNVLKKRDDV